MKLNWLNASLIASAMVFALSGCHVESEQSTSSSSTTTTGTTPSKGKLKVVFIPKTSANPYFEDVDSGFKEGAEKLGYDFTDIAPASGDATSQLATIKEQVQRGVDVIAISPNSPDALNNALDEAKAKGIIVITVDADLVGNEAHRVAAVLASDSKTTGMGQLETLGSEIGYTGDFAILSATKDAPNQNAWIAAMTEGLKDPKYSKMHLIDTVYGNDDADTSTREAEGLFSKHPNLRGIISPTSVGLAAAAQALQIAGKYPGGPHAVGQGLVLTGLSTPNQMKKFTEAGVVAKFQLWRPHDLGLAACYLIKGLKDGTQKTTEGSAVDVPGLGTKTFGPHGVLYAGSLFTFDKSNISGFNF
jgi:rhamnose transport system substrate-binding protein